MGWLQNFVQDPVGTVAETVNEVWNGSVRTAITLIDPLDLTKQKDKILAGSQGIVPGAIKIGAGAYGTLVTGGSNLIGSQADVRSFLKDPGTKSATFGLSDDFAGFSSTTDKYLQGGDPNQTDLQGAMRFTAKYAGAVGVAATAGVLGAAAPTGAQTLTGYAVGQNLQSGNIRGAAGAIGIPGSITQLLPGGQQPGIRQPGAPPPGPLQPGSSSSIFPDFAGGADFLSDPTGNPAVAAVAVAAVVGLVIARKRGLI